jgi:hypothetical protein
MPSHGHSPPAPRFLCLAAAAASARPGARCRHQYHHKKKDLDLASEKEKKEIRLVSTWGPLLLSPCVIDAVLGMPGLTAATPNCTIAPAWSRDGGLLGADSSKSSMRGYTSRLLCLTRHLHSGKKQHLIYAECGAIGWN